MIKSTMPCLLTTLVCLLLFISCGPSLKFVNSNSVPSTELKDQKMTGKCWSFASTSFLETEAIRLDHDIPELSSFYFVYYSYLDVCAKYLEEEGDVYNQFGDLTFSVLSVLDRFGAMPEAIYNGKLSTVNSSKEKNNRMDEENRMNQKILFALDSMIQLQDKSSLTLDPIISILDEFVGAPPTNFTFNDKTYTPIEFSDEILKIDPNEYVEITSYSHISFNEFISLDIPANWRGGQYYNMPIDSLIKLIDHGLEAGYTFAWDGDIGYRGGFLDKGIGIVKGEYEDVAVINQENRQNAFESGSTTDDHNMHLVGSTYHKDGTKFYIFKNSWGIKSGYDGYWYLSENYFRLRTISITSHIDLLNFNLMER